MISEADIQKVSDATDFVALVAETTQVRQKGRDFWCCCPFHKEKTPSCKINPVDNIWHCFGCGEGGTVFTYVMKLHNMSFVESVHFLADRAHVEITDTGYKGAGSSEKQVLYDCAAEAQKFFATQLLRGKSNGADTARKYLSARGFGLEVCRRWGLGFALGSGTLIKHLTEKGFNVASITKANLASVKKGQTYDRFYNRVMFPIYDERGTCVAFGGRVIGAGEPKYLNSSETPIFHKSNVLFGLNFAKNEIVKSGYAVVVEGYTDVIAMHEAGIKNVVATLGTALTLRHIKLLGRYANQKIVYLFDGDEAGQRAAERACEFIDYQMTPEAGQSRCDLHAATIPNNQDPAEFIAKSGAGAMLEILENSRPLVEFGITRRIARHDLSTPEGRSRALIDAISILAPIKDSILAKDYAAQIASMTRVSEKDAQRQLASLKKPGRRAQQQGPVGAPANVSHAQQTPPAAPTNEQAAPQQVLNVDQNRLNNEAKVVALAVQNPLLALENADALSNIHWQNNVHKSIIDAELEILAVDLNVSPSALLNRVLNEVAKSEAIVTSSMAPDEQAARRQFEIAFLNVKIDELQKKHSELTLLLSGETDSVKHGEILAEIGANSKRIAELKGQIRTLED